MTATEVLAHCVEDSGEWPHVQRCNKPATVIIWGKLYPPEALGPKCAEHARKHLGESSYLVCQSAVFHLQGLKR